MSQEAANTFSEGLIMDLNPLTTPNNVLTNCLNGTFITFNGNEFVLQNDMGNGRVETAYLPSGYVPVGIKEHGGIIYVASYNPLTNRSQIGSFPSPERNISSEELNAPEQSLNFESFFSGDINNCQLTSTVARLQLSTHVIRSGDKFSIMVQNNDTNLFKWISNWNNTEIINEKRKIKYRHNKLLTLQIATEDSSGNLIDITEQLKRTTGIENEVITFSASDSPKIQFNTGQFLQYSGEGGSSASIENVRNSKALNTYNNKIFGNLYLVATLNNITNYSVSVYGTKSPDEKVKDCTLTFEITYDYNCPDGGIYLDTETNTTGMLKEDACNASDYNPTNVMKGNILKLTYSEADIFKDPLGTEDSKVQEGNNYTATYHKQFYLTGPDADNHKGKYLPEYNELTELYTLDNSYDVNLSTNTGILSYELTPEMTYGKLDGLKIVGSINLDLLGSGLTSLNVWKYYINDGGSTDITWGMQSYPKYGEEIKRVIFDFIELESGSIEQTLEIGGRESYNGVFTNAVQLEIGKIYIVRISIFQDLIDRQWEGVVRKNEIYTKERVWWEYEEDEEDEKYLVTEWRTLICDYTYNQYYSTKQDMTLDIKGIDTKLEISTNITCNKSPNYTLDNIEIQQSPIEQEYLEAFVHNQLKLDLQFTNECIVNNSLFQVSNQKITNSITDANVILDPYNLISDNANFISEYILPNELLLNDNSDDKITLSGNSITIFLNIPLQYSLTQITREVSKCYRPLKYNLKAVIGYSGGSLVDMVRLDPHFGGKKGKEVYRNVYMVWKNNSTRIYNDSSSTNYDPLLQVDGISQLNQRTSAQFGVLPMFASIHCFAGDDTAYRKDQNSGLESASIVLMRATDDQYYTAVMQKGKTPYQMDANTLTYRTEDFGAQERYMKGDLFAVLHEVFLERLYTEQEYSGAVLCYAYYGGKYINQLKGTCKTLVNTECNTYDIMYKYKKYDSSTVDSYLRKIIFYNGNQEFKDLYNNLVPNKLDFNDTSEYSSQVIFEGSYILRNKWNEIINNFNTSNIAIINYRDQYNAIALTGSGNPLISNYWYWLDIQGTYDGQSINNIDIQFSEVPKTLSDIFVLSSDGIPLMNLRNVYLSQTSANAIIGYDNLDDVRSRGWRFRSTNSNDGRMAMVTMDVARTLYNLVAMDFSYYENLYDLR